MGILAFIYRLRYRGKKMPASYNRSIGSQFVHSIRKGICQNIAPNCVSNFMRISLYRLCGFKIGKGCFIGMKCYLDDVDPSKTIIGNNVVISYGVYFACHGRKQTCHNTIVIHDRVYIGMRANIIAPSNIEIGERSIIGAGTLVNRSVPDHSVAVGVPCRILDKK